MTRIACLLVPDLLVAAELRAHPELRGEPLAIASGSDPRAEVVGVSGEAARVGVRPLCSVAQARSLCARLHVRVASPALEGAARSALRDVALSASPRIEEAPRASGLHAGEAAVFLDAAGIDRLFGSEAGFASALLDRAERLGLPAVVALAGSRSVALVAARSTSSPPAPISPVRWAASASGAWESSRASPPPPSPPGSVLPPTSFRPWRGGRPGSFPSPRSTTGFWRKPPTSSFP
jgi:nucleotidyltransferase/DNA polymerase involved in DNA repair